MARDDDGTADGGAGGPRIGLVGPWIANRGDELMLHAVTRKFGADRIALPTELWPAGSPDPRMRPVALPPDRIEAQQALRRKDGARLVALGLKAAAMKLPQAGLRKLTGYGDARRLDVVLDSSGFAYGDDWSAERMNRRARYFGALKAGGTRIVMLPQAFGPFEKPDIRQAAQALLATCEAAYARDADSLAHLQRLDLPQGGPRLGQAPDITHLLDTEEPTDAGDWRRRVVIVPNARMLDRTSEARAAAYERFIVDAVAAVRSHGLEPHLMLHEDNDRDLVARIISAAGAVPVLEGDGLKLKGVIRNARMVIASRYHALVSSLSQGVPAIGTSWSHKYDRLFEEYGHTDYLLAPEGEPGTLRARVDQLLSEPVHTELRTRLNERAMRQRRAVEAMWDEVAAVMKGVVVSRSVS